MGNLRYLHIIKAIPFQEEAKIRFFEQKIETLKNTQWTGWNKIYPRYVYIKQKRLTSNSLGFFYICPFSHIV